MACFEPANAAFERRVRDSFARQKAMGYIGASLMAVRPGEVEIELPYRAELTQQHAYIHGGIVGMIADNACGYAAFTLMPAEATVLTVEYKVNLLAPADGERLVARGRVLRPGRTVVVAEARVHAVQGGAEVLVAVALATLLALHGRADAPRPAGDSPGGRFAKLRSAPHSR